MYVRLVSPLLCSRSRVTVPLFLSLSLSLSLPLSLFLLPSVYSAKRRARYVCSSDVRATPARTFTTFVFQRASAETILGAHVPFAHYGCALYCIGNLSLRCTTTDDKRVFSEHRARATESPRTSTNGHARDARTLSARVRDARSKLYTAPTGHRHTALLSTLYFSPLPPPPPRRSSFARSLARSLVCLLAYSFSFAARTLYLALPHSACNCTHPRHGRSARSDRPAKPWVCSRQC
jgi:hypothetical protein